MGVRRTRLDFEGKFTQVPNEWARDERLSRRARGLLLELMSHRVGWHITIAALQKAGTEGRDAIRVALLELSDAGYLRRIQGRGERGRFNEIEYELCEPTVVGKSDTGGFTDSGQTDGGATDDGESAPKNTRDQEHDLVEDEGEPPLFCSKHPNGSESKCGPCGSARRRHDRWTRDQAAKPSPGTPRPPHVNDAPAAHEHKYAADGYCLLCGHRMLAVVS